MTRVDFYSHEITNDLRHVGVFYLETDF
jgi:hypothetical protein